MMMGTRFGVPIFVSAAYRHVSIDVNSITLFLLSNRVTVRRSCDGITIVSQPAVDSDFCAVCWLAESDQRPMVVSEYWKWAIYLVAHQ
jgi:hypothetical protein